MAAYRRVDDCLYTGISSGTDLANEYVKPLPFAFFIRSTLRQSRPNKAGLKCPSARTYLRPFTKSFFDFNEIRRVGEVDE